MINPTLTYRASEESFSDFLRRVRLGFEMAESDFANFLGVKQHVLDRWMTGDTRYIHAKRMAKWADFGIYVPTAAGKDAPAVFQQLRDEVESLVDDDGNLLYSEVDLLETIEWIQLFKASKEKKTSAATVRKWARANGHAVTAKGRVPTKLKVLYSLAHENTSS